MKIKITNFVNGKIANYKGENIDKNGQYTMFSSLKEASNVVIQNSEKSNLVSTRGGFRFITSVENASALRTIPFSSEIGQNNVGQHLIFTDTGIKVININNGEKYILRINKNYSRSFIEQFDYASANDTLILTHGSITPQKMNFNQVSPSIANLAYIGNDKGLYYNLFKSENLTNNLKMRFDASGNIRPNRDYTFYVGDVYLFQVPSTANNGKTSVNYVQIITVDGATQGATYRVVNGQDEGATQVSVDFQSKYLDYYISIDSVRLKDKLPYPVGCCFSNQRLFFILDTNIFASRIGADNYNDFYLGADSFTSDAPIYYKLFQPTIDFGSKIQPSQDGIYYIASESLYRLQVSSADVNTANTLIRTAQNEGSYSNLKPKVKDYWILTVDGKRKSITASFSDGQIQNLYTKTFFEKENNVIKGKIIDMGIQQTPSCRLWLLIDNGTIILANVFADSNGIEISGVTEIKRSDGKFVKSISCLNFSNGQSPSILVTFQRNNAPPGQFELLEYDEQQTFDQVDQLINLDSSEVTTTANIENVQASLNQDILNIIKFNTYKGLDIILPRNMESKKYQLVNIIPYSTSSFPDGDMYNAQVFDYEPRERIRKIIIRLGGSGSGNNVDNYINIDNHNYDPNQQKNSFLKGYKIDNFLNNTIFCLKNSANIAACPKFIIYGGATSSGARAGLGGDVILSNNFLYKFNVLNLSSGSNGDISNIFNVQVPPIPGPPYPQGGKGGGLYGGSRGGIATYDSSGVLVKVGRQSDPLGYGGGGGSGIVTIESAAGKDKLKIYGGGGGGGFLELEVFIPLGITNRYPLSIVVGGYRRSRTVNDLISGSALIEEYIEIE